jgi:SOS response regulatory protein OraA/RecX
MYRNDSPPLAPWLEVAYDRLADEIHHQESGLATNRARTLLHTEGLCENEEDAQYAIERLLGRGYLYTVDDELFVTEPDQYSTCEPN